MLWIWDVRGGGLTEDIGDDAEGSEGGEDGEGGEC